MGLGRTHGSADAKVRDQRCVECAMLFKGIDRHAAQF